ncbi:MAG: hypothetical protein HYU34_03175 [Candidatus Omnitrophica bacterium]|nr:hypothetical protein [Candidatus Omnitrophota bacterium]
MQHKRISAEIMNNFNESDGEERRFVTDSSEMILCQVGSSSTMEVRRVNPTSTPVYVVGGHRELARDRNNLGVNYRWLIKDPRDSQKYLSIFVSRRKADLTDGILEEMAAIQQI